MKMAQLLSPPKTLRNVIWVTILGIGIGTSYANEVISPTPRDPNVTCPTQAGAAPENPYGWGCGTGCSPFPDGCCEYKEYMEDGQRKIWRKCNLLMQCGNPIGVPDGYHPDGYHYVIPVPPGGGGNY